MSLFDNALRFARMHNPNFQPSKMQPQKRPTSRPLRAYMDKVRVKILIDASWPIRYTKAGHPAKRQPTPFKPGDTVYVRLNGDGLLHLYPFELAGSGYELVSDAEEGVHFEFM